VVEMVLKIMILIWFFKGGFMVYKLDFKNFRFIMIVENLIKFNDE